jgi:hypothetical protein
MCGGVGGRVSEQVREHAGFVRMHSCARVQASVPLEWNSNWTVVAGCRADESACQHKTPTGKHGRVLQASLHRGGKRLTTRTRGPL